MPCNKLKLGVLLSVLMTSSGVFAEMSDDEFQSLINDRGGKGSEVGSSQEVQVESIEVPEIFREIDNHQLRVNRLEKMIAIAKLEKEYAEMTGSAPSGAVTPVGSSGTAHADMDSMIMRDEIESLKQQIAGMSEEKGNDSGNEALPVLRKSEAWSVKGISIYGDKHSAVISRMLGSDFVIRQGDVVDGVTIVSINPDEVRVKEAGKVMEIPLSGTSYSSTRGEGMAMERLEDNVGVGPNNSRATNKSASYPEVLDSTSR